MFCVDVRAKAVAMLRRDSPENPKKAAAADGYPRRTEATDAAMRQCGVFRSALSFQEST
jgi:hypothetical protein